MTKNTVGTLVKSLMDSFPGFRAAGKLFYRPVIDGMLVGCYFEPSDFEKKTVQITCFATILAYPLNSLAFDLAFRVRDGRGGDRWNLGNHGAVVSEITDAIRLQALPFVERMRVPVTFAEEVSSGVNTVQSQRAAAVAFARVGETKRALDLIAKISPELNPSVAWQREIAVRLAELSERLGAGNAASLLDSWEAASVAMLKVA